MLTILILVASSAIILFGWLALRLFRRSRRLVLATVFALLCIFFVLADIKLLQFHKMTSAPPPMMMTTVTSAEVKNADWQPMLTAVGSFSPVQGAMISAELAGTVAEINFQSGSLVKKGEVLLKLDASAEEAQRRSAEADLTLAKNDLDRAHSLAERKVISAAEFDATQSKYSQKKASVENMQ